MLLTKFIKIKIHPTTFNHYEEKGYDVNVGSEILVKVEDLTKSSTYKVKVKCDVCGSEKELSFNKYLKNISKHNLYDALGFKFISKTEPNYYYIINGIRKHRFNFRKDVLIKEGFDKNKTEHEIMLERKIYRIYDSGNLKFIYNNYV